MLEACPVSAAERSVPTLIPLRESRRHAVSSDAMAPLRIVVVDDHAVVRSGLKLVLDAEEDLEVVAEAGDARSAVFEVRAEQPDVVLLDVTMPGKSGIEAIPDLLHEAPGAKILILSM